MHPHREGRSASWRAAVPLVAALGGLLFVASALSANGTDLRAGPTDLSTLVQQRADAVAAQRAQQRTLRAEIAALTGSVDSKSVVAAQQQAAAQKPAAGLTGVTGPGLAVTLQDSPRGQQIPPGLNADALVVHQQDIQAFVNALWAGGAQAISLQGQRLIATTGIKCVGNTVVLEGVPYSPPYRIEAVGDVTALERGLDNSTAVQTYRQYVAVVNLGLTVEPRSSLDIPAYGGTVTLQYARTP
ncbi:MAG: DUF881 domain-containing protein [Nocardioidaceae bacterium]